MQMRRPLALAALTVAALGGGEPAVARPCLFLGSCTTTTTAPRTPVTTMPTTSPTAAKPPAPASAPAVAAGEARADAELLFALVNRERTVAGLPPFTWRQDVADLASGHSRAMAAAGTIYHDDAWFTSATKAAVGARRVGENVAVNTSLVDAHARLLASPGHRSNLLSGFYSAAGFSVWRATSGSLFVTQRFLEPSLAPRTALPGPRSAPPTPPAPPAAAAAAAASASGAVTASPPARELAASAPADAPAVRPHAARRPQPSAREVPALAAASAVAGLALAAARLTAALRRPRRRAVLPS